MTRLPRRPNGLGTERFAERNQMKDETLGLSICGREPRCPNDQKKRKLRVMRRQSLAAQG